MSCPGLFDSIIPIVRFPGSHPYEEGTDSMGRWSQLPRRSAAHFVRRPLGVGVVWEGEGWRRELVSEADSIQGRGVGEDASGSAL